jgi:pseudouridine synthase
VVSDGERLSASGVEVLRTTRENTWVSVHVLEGRNRQVRRMCEAVGHPVMKLLRVSLGPLALGQLSRGQWRRLLPSEVAALEALKAKTGTERP